MTSNRDSAGPAVGAGSRRRWWVRAGWVLFVVVVVGLGFWAGRTIGSPAAAPLPQPATSTYLVKDGVVGRTVALVASASWDTTVIARAGAAGTVTSLDVTPGQQVSSGDVLVTVDLRPMVVVAGTVPAFRDLKVGDRGADVKQLQTFLAVGHPGVPLTGVFDTATAAAVLSWQQTLGLAGDGTVRRGDVVFVPGLPRRVTLAAGVAVGAQVGPGTDLVSAVAADPRVELQMSTEQAATVPTSGRVLVHAGSATWHGVIAGSHTAQPGQLVLPLTAADGSPICGADCVSAIPLGDPTLLPTDVVVVPQTSGPVVPVAAIHTGADNSTTITTAGGASVPVTVLVSADGLAVVSGIDAGALVVIPAAPVQ